MNAGEAFFLCLVFVAFGGFAVTLAYETWRQSAAKES